MDDLTELRDNYLENIKVDQKKFGSEIIDLYIQIANAFIELGKHEKNANTRIELGIKCIHFAIDLVKELGILLERVKTYRYMCRIAAKIIFLKNLVSNASETQEKIKDVNAKIS